MKRKNIYKCASAILCSTMIMGNILPVMAETTETQSTSAETDSKETDVLYTKSASYFVTIPKNIVLGTDKASNYSVKVEGDITSDKQVYVSPIDGISETDGFDFYMRDTNTAAPKADVATTVTQNKFYWNFQDVAASYEETNNKIEADGLTSGTWKGTFDFEINMHKIDDEETAGIRVVAIDADTNQLSASATQLKDEKREQLLQALKDSCLIYGYNTATNLIELRSNDFDDMTKATIYVSGALKEKDYAVIIRYNEQTNQYEHIGGKYVDANETIVIDFANPKPVPFADAGDGGIKVIENYKLDGQTLVNAMGTVSNYNTRNISSFKTSKTPLTDADNSIDLSKNKDGSIVLYEKDNELTLYAPEKVHVVNSLSMMFYQYENLSSVDFSNMDTSEVTNMSNMFYQCSKLQNLSFLSDLDTGYVSDMSNMFSWCEGLKTITKSDLANLNTNRVSNMTDMFSYCFGLTSVDISGLNVSNSFYLDRMFALCERMTDINIGEFNAAKANSMNDLFNHCAHLNSITWKGTTYSSVADFKEAWVAEGNLDFQ